MARKKQSKNAKKKRPSQGNTSAPCTAQHLPNAGPKGQGRSCGATAGPAPNLYWGHVSMEELRACPRFVGLAEPSGAPLACPAASRYVRQDSPAWRQLHTGVLTTGLLKEALGLREPQATRVVGGRNESSHAPLLAAFQHLQQPPQLPPATSPLEEAAWRRQAVEALVRQQQQLRGHSEQQQRRRRQALETCEMDTLDAHQDDDEDENEDDDERYRFCAAALSGGGLVGVRCAWGKTQEAAALAQLLHIFPTSTLHEVGLCCVPGSSPAVASRPGLPPLAASPDALITHHLRLEPHEAGSLLAALREAGTEGGMEGGQPAGAGVGCAPGTTQHYQQHLQQDSQWRDAQQDVRGGGPVLASAAQRLQQLLRELLLRVPMDLRAGSDDGDGDDDSGGDVDGDGGGHGNADRDDGDAAGGSVRRVSGDGEDGEGLEDEEGSLAPDGGTELEEEEEEEEEEEDEAAEAEGAEESIEGRTADGDGDGRGEHRAEAGGAARGGGSWEPSQASASQRLEGTSCGAVDPAHVASRAASAAAAAAAAGAVAASSSAAALAVCAAEGARTVSTSPAAAAVAAAATDAVAAAAAVLYGNLLAVVLESSLPAVMLCSACCGRRKPQPLAAAAAVDSAASGTDSGGGATASYRSTPTQPSSTTGDAVSGAAGGLDGDDWNPEQHRALWCVCERGAVDGRGAAELCSSIRAAPAAAAAVPASGDADGGVDGGGGSDAVHCASAPGAVHVVLREVVEVKNTCPFGIRQVRRGGKGRLVSELVLSDPGPRRAVSPLWVPQLQLHMLATGCRSGLLVSRSATKGTSMFRMWRDDDYLARMLGLLERFNCEFVRRGVPPPHDMFARQPDYMAFLGATARLARTAVSLTADAPWRPRPADAGGLVLPDGGAMNGAAGGISDSLVRGPLDRDKAFLRREGRRRPK